MGSQKQKIQTRCRLVCKYCIYSWEEHKEDERRNERKGTSMWSSVTATIHIWTCEARHVCGCICVHLEPRQSASFSIFTGKVPRMHSTYARISNVSAFTSSCLMTLLVVVALSSFMFTADPKGDLLISSVKVLVVFPGCVPLRKSPESRFYLSINDRTCLS
jgi:hypothetical protein